MTFSDILSGALRYYDIINDGEYIKAGSIVMKNTYFVDNFIDEVNVTAECYDIDDRLERGFNVTSMADLVVISPFKRRE